MLGSTTNTVHTLYAGKSHPCILYFGHQLHDLSIGAAAFGGGSVFFVSDYFISTRLCRRSLSQVPRIEKLIAVQGMTLRCTVKLKTPCMINSTSKFALNLVTTSINMYLKIHLKNKQTSMANPLKSGPWSHVGKGGLPRWSHLGARWPLGAIFH